MRLGLIGAGRWGKRYIETIKAMPDVALAHLASSNPASRRLVPEGCTVSANWASIFDDRTLDGVILATPPQTHASLALAAIDANLPVLIEKPMTLSVDDARKVASAAARRGVLVVVDHTHLFSPAYRELKHRGAGLGQLKRIETCGANWGPFRSDVPMLWDYGPHDIAMCLDLTGHQATDVAANSESAVTTAEGSGEAIQLQLYFDGALEARVRLSNVDRTKSRWLNAMYPGGTLRYDDIANPKLTYDPADASGSRRPQPVAAVDPTPPLTVAVSEFCSKVAAGDRSHPSLELGVQVIGVLAACARAVRAASPPARP